MKPRPGGRKKRNPALEKLRALESPVFTLRDLGRILGRSATGSTTGMFAVRMVDAGDIVRLRRGLFALPDRVPTTLEPLLNHAAAGAPYQVAFRSAMAAHGFGEVPAVLQVAVNRVRRGNPQLTQEVRVQYLERDGSHTLSETERREVPGLGPLTVTTLEATLLDALTQPKHCGGFLEVVRFLMWGRGRWSGEAIAASLKRRKRDSLTRRVGYLLERAQDPAARVVARELLPNPWAWSTWLVPVGGFYGDIDRRWRLRVNHDVAALDEALRLPEGVAIAQGSTSPEALPRPRRTRADPWAEAFEREAGR